MSDTLPKELRAAARLAHLLDDQWRIPIVGIRFGIDPLLGLFPVLGDLISAFIAISIVRTAVKYKLPPKIWMAMILNIALDFGIGLLPVVGDILDIFFKSNARNIKLLEKHFAERL